MTAIARGQTSQCTNPILDVFTLVNGVLTDVFALSFQIFDVSDAAKQQNPVQVYPATLGEKQAVDVGVTCPAAGAGKISTGRYVATWTASAAEPLGSHRIKWFFKLTSSSAELTYSEEFEVLTEAMATGQTGYCTVTDLRNEGVPSSVSDSRLGALIHLASRMIDKYTGRWFEARTRTFVLDGTGTPVLWLGHPVIAVSAVTMNDESVDSASFKVYNRHVGGLLDPDDRENPKLEFVEGFRLFEFQRTRNRAVWTSGAQNVRVTGVFGYTDPDDSSTTGVTPELIKHACKLMVVRELPTMGEGEDRFESQNRYRITEERTRDQSYKMGPGRAELMQGSGADVYTGDPEIDGILALFSRPPFVGAV